MRVIFSILFILTVTNALFGQQIQGYVNDENTGKALDSILIKATSESDTTKQKIATTDATGFYELKDIITGVGNIPGFEDDKLIIIRNGSQLQIKVTSRTCISTGKLYTLDGRTISLARFEKIGINEFKAVFNIQGIAEQTVLFSDGFHPSVKIIPSQLSRYGIQSMNFVEPSLKSANANENNIKFELDDDAGTDNYQPLVIVKEVNLENTNYFDFQLIPWQKFYSTLNFNLEDTKGNKLNNESVKIKHLNSSLEYSDITDSNGDAVIENIPVPNMEGNKGIPDSLDFAVEISGNDIETELDTLWKVTAGELFLNYHNLTPKNTQPEDKQYTIIIHSKDENGNDNNNVAWTISTTDKTLSWTGNTGSNALDTLSFLNPNTSLNLQINSSKDEYTNYDATKNITSGQSTITTVNELLKYLYQLQVSGKDSETKAVLDSIDVQAFLNGKLLMNGNSLANTIVNLQTTQPGHSLDLKVLMDRDGYVRSDSIPITINEGQANNLVYELVKEPTVPTDEQYTLVINSQDGQGNNLANVNWQVLDANSAILGSGNTGSNALDTLQFLNINPNLNVTIKSDKTEHTDYSNQTNIVAETVENRITVNELLKYLYQMQISGKDSETQTALDSISGQIFVNGQLLTSGNSLEEQILNLQTTQAGHTLDVMSILNRNGYFADTLTTTISEGQVNQIIHQLTKEPVIPVEKQYTLVINSKDGQGNNLADVNWQVLTSDSTLIGNGNTGSNALDTLKFQNINPNVNIILKSNKADHTDYRTETSLAAETTENRTTINELIQQQNAVAYLWRAIRDPLNQLGTTADITISNEEFNYTDTRSVQDLIAWKDTVPVNATGTTPYTITIHPHVTSGKIPLYDLVKVINLSPNQTAQGYDDLKSLEQQVVIKGDLDGSDGGEAGVVNVVFTNSSGQQFTTTTNSSGEYRLGPFPVGTTGDIDFIIPTSNPKSSTYFNHKDIPVGGTMYISLGTVPLTSGPITAFEDSVLTYNPLMIQKQWTYPVTGEKVTIHPEYLKQMEGSSYNASWALWGEQRVYNTPNSDNPDWPTQMGAFIEKHTGIPYNVIIVDTPRESSVTITSLDPTYLQSKRNQMGNNISSLVGTAGLTNIHSAGTIDGLTFHSTADITLRSPEVGEEPTDFMYVVGMRELIGRNGELSQTNQYVSFMNGSTPLDLKVTDMTQDFANVAIIYTNMSSRAKRLTHTGLYTLSED